MVNVLFKREK